MPRRYMYKTASFPHFIGTGLHKGVENESLKKNCLELPLYKIILQKLDGMSITIPVYVVQNGF